MSYSTGKRGPSLVKDTRWLYNALYDKMGVLRDIPIDPVSSIRERPDYPRILRFLKSYMEFILNSGVVNHSTLIYLRSDVRMSTSKVFLRYCEKNESNTISAKSHAANVDNARKKLAKLFDNDMLEKIFENSSTLDISKYEQQLEAAMQKYYKVNLFDGLLGLDLPHSMNSDGSTVTAKELEVFAKSIFPYRRVQIERMKRFIIVEFKPIIEYYNYLFHLQDRTFEEEQRLQEMKDFLSEDVGDFLYTSLFETLAIQQGYENIAEFASEHDDDDEEDGYDDLGTGGIVFDDDEDDEDGYGDLGTSGIVFDDEKIDI